MGRQAKSYDRKMEVRSKEEGQRNGTGGQRTARPTPEFIPVMVGKWYELRTVSGLENAMSEFPGGRAAERAVRPAGDPG